MSIPKAAPTSKPQAKFSLLAVFQKKTNKPVATVEAASERRTSLPLTANDFAASRVVSVHPAGQDPRLPSNVDDGSEDIQQVKVTLPVQADGKSLSDSKIPSITSEWWNKPVSIDFKPVTEEFLRALPVGDAGAVSYRMTPLKYVGGGPGEYLFEHKGEVRSFKANELAMTPDWQYREVQQRVRNDRGVPDFSVSRVHLFPMQDGAKGLKYRGEPVTYWGTDRSGERFKILQEGRSQFIWVQAESLHR